ncbi:MAG: hypothetical protein HXY30_06020 [Pseudorhodoplanes sp.]|nr:hypothetical protein [Pseudorhodoplanes sp.]
MNKFAQLAFVNAVRDSGFVALAGLTLMTGFSFDPELAFMIGGQISLIFCLGLLYRVSQIERTGICRTETWRMLPPDERPGDGRAIRRAHDDLQRTLLSFAAAAAGVAALLLTLALIA